MYQFSEDMWNVSSLIDVLRWADLNNWKALLRTNSGCVSTQKPVLKRLHTRCTLLIKPEWNVFPKSNVLALNALNILNSLMNAKIFLIGICWWRPSVYCLVCCSRSYRRSGVCRTQGENEMILILDSSFAWIASCFLLRAHERIERWSAVSTVDTRRTETEVSVIK